MKKNYKVVILTAGRGERLQPETNYYNKALITIGNKTALSKIIELFDDDVEIVLANNYKADTIKDFVEIAYPDRNFTYVEVDNIGQGYGPGYALLKCEEYLQCPFYFFTCDTLIDKEDLLDLENNWVGIREAEGSHTFYSKVIAEGEDFGKGDAKRLIHGIMKAKSYSWSSDVNKDTYAFIGCAGIRDYKQYFKNLKESKLIRNEIQILSGFVGLTTDAKLCYSWQDVGTRESLEKARKSVNDVNPFRKMDEFTVEADNKIIKFNANKKWISDRLIRSKILNKLVPESKVRGSFLYYDKVDGELLSNLLNEKLDTVLFIKFLNWCSENLWIDIIIDEDLMKETAAEFYYFKTLERMKQLYSTTDIKDGQDVINGVKTRHLEQLLDLVKPHLIYMLPKTFHGDLHIGNVIIDKDKKFHLIDWRQNMNGRIDIGDMYYDLAKMLHAFILPHKSLSKGKFVVDKTINGHIWYGYDENDILKEYAKQLEWFAIREGLDWSRVELLTAIVYINMSPLHPSPYRELLYYLGKRKLHKWVEKHYESNN